MKDLEKLRIRIKGPNKIALAVLFGICTIGFAFAIAKSVFTCATALTPANIVFDVCCIVSYLSILIAGTCGYRIRSFSLLRYGILLFAILFASAYTAFFASCTPDNNLIAIYIINVVGCIVAAYTASRLHTYTDTCIALSVGTLIFGASTIYGLILACTTQYGSLYEAFNMTFATISPLIIWFGFCGCYLLTHYLAPSLEENAK